MKISRWVLVAALATWAIFSACQTAQTAVPASSTPSAWVPDLGNGTYKNPIIYADYSDPDVVRVGEDFYLTASSFTCVPGLPVLHSKDLVNWTIIGHALPVQVPADHFSQVRSGGGVWAPCIRFHSGKFYIYYPDPDFGIYVVTATNPAGPWSAPTMVKAGKGLIDPTPLFDDDGKAYLLHAWARSRSGKNNILTLVPLNSEGTAVTGEGKDVILGETFNVTTLEGPKFYKLNGYYWVFAPVGGVSSGPQAVFRSKNIEGPYEMRTVLAQGGTPTNGPHQGGLVNTPDGKQWWFIHFQQKGAYGRITHLEPVTWRADGWPVMGNDPNNTGTGTPVLTFAKPAVGKTYPLAEPQTSDEFNSEKLGLQWQWLANPKPEWYSLTAKPGSLRLFSQPGKEPVVQRPSLLMQKLPAPAFSVTAKVDFTGLQNGDIAALLIYGNPCQWIAVTKRNGQMGINQGTAAVPDGAGDFSSGSGTIFPLPGGIRMNGELMVPDFSATPGTIYLKLDFTANSRVRFSYSADGVKFFSDSEPTAVVPVTGSWIGAKFGLAVSNAAGTSSGGYADFDWVQVTPFDGVTAK